MSDYKFPELEPIEKLADKYMELDLAVQMRVKNGMSRELYVNYSILNTFMNHNDLDLERDQRGIVTESSLLRVAQVCAPHYSRAPEELVDAFVRNIGTEFLDADARKRVEDMWKRILPEEN
jgi:hypothetical protein